MQNLLVKGMSGADVAALKTQLKKELGDLQASAFGGLAGEQFDSDTEAAVRNWQSGVGLIADGIIGPHCLTLLGLRIRKPLEIVPDLAAVRRLFPQTKPSNIARYLPYVTCALEAYDLVQRSMVLAALGTIRAETAGFLPISEYPSRFNTPAGKPAFSAYDGRMGNLPGEGEKFRGRGFVQLTGKNNYARFGAAIGLDLVANPDWANAPEVAAVLLASYLAAVAPKLKSSLALDTEAGYACARKLVNGGSHGLQEFTSIFRLAKAVWPPAPQVASGVAAAPRTSSATKRSQSPASAVRTRDTNKDPPDLRDRQYQPPPVSLPDEFPAEADVRAMFKAYRSFVLDQGQEGACTGFGLACVINFARWQKAGWPAKLELVSPRMLYNYARRYDEYAGENYEGSSCRGALKGWFNHGVCLEKLWPYDSCPTYGYLDEAAKITLGVYYRVDLKSIVDMQAAIKQTHAIYVSANTHSGWDGLKSSTRQPGHKTLPVIAFDGMPSGKQGHAFALVGFNCEGFIVQNSWGASWGMSGFAVLTYADWLANGMDAWVASLGVSGVTEGRLTRTAASRAGRTGASLSREKVQAQWWDESVAYRHSIVLGDDGRVSRYEGTDELTRSLQAQACSLPDAWFRQDPVARASEVKRLVIYAHGGLNSEAEAIARARAMGRYFTANGCYPIFLVWKTGLWESISNILSSRHEDQRAGAWQLSDATDAIIERTMGRGPVRALWNEMKGNAAFSCKSGRGGDLLVNALKGLSATWGDKLEIHLVGHSAGSIILGHLLELIARRGFQQRVASLHLYAPACTVQFSNRQFGPASVLQRTWLHILGDEIEKGDSTAGIYRKSLLYLVSNALEPDVRTPLLGLCNARDAAYAGWDGSSGTNEALTNWRAAVEESGLELRTQVLTAAQVVTARARDTGEVIAQIPASHGSFDNDVDLIGSTLARITGAPLLVSVDDLRGF
jgi:predicted chitinase